jgi:hypothetical protein
MFSNDWEGTLSKAAAFSFHPLMNLAYRNILSRTLVYVQLGYPLLAKSGNVHSLGGTPLQALLLGMQS